MNVVAPTLVLLLSLSASSVVLAGSPSPSVARRDVLRKSAPQITPANTATQIDPRRLAYPWNDENARHPVAQYPNMRGPLHRNASFGSPPYRPASAVNTFYLLSGKRAVTDRAGDRSFDTAGNTWGNWPMRRNVFYSNRTLVLRRHSFRARR